MGYPGDVESAGGYPIYDPRLAQYVVEVPQREGNMPEAQRREEEKQLIQDIGEFHYEGWVLLASWLTVLKSDSSPIGCVRRYGMR